MSHSHPTRVAAATQQAGRPTADRKAVVVCDHVRLSYPIYSFDARSLRNVVFSHAVGGRLKKSAQHQVMVQALDGISFTLYEGDRLGIAGHNGSGKSTLLRVLAGIYQPDQGSVSIDGKVSSYLDLALGLDYEATGRDNVRTLLRLRGLTQDEIDALSGDIVSFSGLEGYIDLPVRTYSQGMLSRLVFATATAVPAGVLLMDEWLSAGDARFTQQARERMETVFHSAKVSILATHNDQLIHSTCNKLLILEGGKAIYFGDTNKVSEVLG